MNESDSLISQHLKTCIAEIGNYNHDKDWSEAETVNKAIVPIVKSIGYHPDDYSIEVQTVTGRQDIVVSYGAPDAAQSEKKFVIEAKKWNHQIGPKEIAQTLTYANNEGHRYAAVTNGKKWIIFDNHIKKSAPEKEILSFEIDSPDAIDWLLCLSKPQMEADRLHKICQEKRAKEVLKAQLENPKSSMIKSVLKALKHDAKDEFKDITPSQLSEWILALGKTEPNSGSEGSEKSKQESTPVGIVQTTQVTKSNTSTHFNSNSIVESSLVDLTDAKTAHSKPASIRIASTNHSAGKWIVVLQTLLGHVYKLGKIPSILEKDPKLSTLIKSKSNGYQSIHKPREIPGSSGNYVFEANLNSKSICRYLHLISKSADLDPDHIIVGWYPNYYD